MTVLALLVASFITQGQPFLPTFSTLVRIQPDKVQQRLISIAQTSHQPRLSAQKTYHKILSIVPDKVSSHQRRVAFNPVLKTASMNASSFTFPESLRLAPGKEWDMPQTPLYDAEERLLAQYYQGQALPVLRYGNTGNAVRVLQTLLTHNRYGVGVNGRFDVLTETAVKAFQANRRLTADGIVGSRTWRELTRYAAFHAKKDPMEIPMFGNQPLDPWQRSFVVNFGESTVSI